MWVADDTEDFHAINPGTSVSYIQWVCVCAGARVFVCSLSLSACKVEQCYIHACFIPGV